MLETIGNTTFLRTSATGMINVDHILKVWLSSDGCSFYVKMINGDEITIRENITSLMYLFSFK